MGWDGGQLQSLTSPSSGGILGALQACEDGNHGVVPFDLVGGRGPAVNTYMGDRPATPLASFPSSLPNSFPAFQGTLL